MNNFYYQVAIVIAAVYIPHLDSHLQAFVISDPLHMFAVGMGSLVFFFLVRKAMAQALSERWDLERNLLRLRLLGTLSISAFVLIVIGTDTTDLKLWQATFTTVWFTLFFEFVILRWSPKWMRRNTS